MPNKNYKKNRGFTLVEVIVAIFVLAMGVVGIMNAIPSMISNLNLYTSKLTAFYLAQEGVEIIRNIRDSNWLQSGSWDNGLTACSLPNGCQVDYGDAGNPNPFLVQDLGEKLNISESGFYEYGGSSPSKFSRKIIITPFTDGLKVEVVVYWDEKGKVASTSVEENLYNWR